MVPYRSNLLPGVWRWWYDFGCGDIGNDGVHDIDVALWGLGVDTHPQRVACLGGKYHFDDDQQFPDTQYVLCEYPAAGSPAQGNAVGTRQFIFEQRIWSPYSQEGYDNGAAFYGTKGMLILGHTRGWRLYGPRNELIAERTGSADLVAHHDDFFRSIREPGRVPHADVQAGLRSAVVVHLANISARVGRTLRFDPERLEIVGDDEAARMLKRNYRKDHWAVPGPV
jgi:predicted dehydrogenase